MVDTKFTQPLLKARSLQQRSGATPPLVQATQRHAQVAVDAVAGIDTAQVKLGAGLSGLVEYQKPGKRRDPSESW